MLGIVWVLAAGETGEALPRQTTQQHDGEGQGEVLPWGCAHTGAASASATTAWGHPGVPALARAGTGSATRLLAGEHVKGEDCWK